MRSFESFRSPGGVLSFLMGAGFFLMGCGKDFSSYVKKGGAQFQDRNYISAVDTLNIGLLQWRKSDGEEARAQAYQLLGKSYHKLRNTDKAMEAYREAVRNSTKTFDSAYAMGILHLAKNQPEAALKAFQKALTMKANDPQSLLGAANSYFALNRPKDAKIYYEKVIDASPGVKEALESLALLKKKSPPKWPKKVPVPTYKRPQSPPPPTSNRIIRKTSEPRKK